MASGFPNGKQLYDWLFPLAKVARGETLDAKIEEGRALVRRTVPPDRAKHRSKQSPEDDHDDRNLCPYP